MIASMILALDPGPSHSAMVLYDGKRVLCATAEEKNEHLLGQLRYGLIDLPPRESIPVPPLVVIEWIESFGMAVGKDVFETCRWIGRFQEAVESFRYPLRPTEPVSEVRLVLRRQVKLHLCGTSRAKDANVRQALIDKFGGREKAIGKKANPGPLYSVKSHAWSALGLAVTAIDGAYRRPPTP